MYQYVDTCPTTGFWQAEQFPLEDVWTPCRLRSDWRSPSMLSSEPPDEGCGGLEGCCGAVTTGVTGAAGWERNMKHGTSVFGILILQELSLLYSWQRMNCHER